jgi:hypothetical protein
MRTMEKTPEPVDWGKDDLSAFIQDAHQITLRCFAQQPNKFQRLRDIHKAFDKLSEYLDNTEEWRSGLFVTQAHSRFLGAARLALAGQVPEAHAVIRTCLECAMYGFYFSQNKASWQTWSAREDSTACEQKVRNEFKAGTMLKLISAENSDVGDVVKNLYDQTIADGAHPNVAAVFTRLKVSQAEGKVHFVQPILSTDFKSTPYELALKNTARAGIAALSVFRLIWPERFKIVGLHDEVNRLASGL